MTKSLDFFTGSSCALLYINWKFMIVNLTWRHWEPDSTSMPQRIINSQNWEHPCLKSIWHHQWCSLVFIYLFLCPLLFWRQIPSSWSQVILVLYKSVDRCFAKATTCFIFSWYLLGIFWNHATRFTIVVTVQSVSSPRSGPAHWLYLACCSSSPCGVMWSHAASCANQAKCEEAVFHRLFYNRALFGMTDVLMWNFVYFKWGEYLTFKTT